MRYIHYWNGYGCSCMTADGRRGDAQCTSDKSKVTCPRCKQNIKYVEGLC